jgi:hypothetical protein
MSSLAELLKKASSAELAYVSTLGHAVDPIRELGLHLERKQYNTRLQALMAPDEYARERGAAFDVMVAEVQKSYTAAYDGFIEAGLPTNMARQYALAAANNEKQVRRQVLETQYPTNANLIGDMSIVNKSATGVMSLPGNMGSRVPTRKPSKRRKPAKRR